MSTVSRPTPARPTTGLLQDLFEVLDRHGYERAPGRTLAAALPTLDNLLSDLAAVYEGQEVPGA